MTAEAVVLGASAGAVQVLSHLLAALPAGYPVPLLIVVHVPADRGNALVPLMQQKCPLIVKEAEDKEPVKAGTVYFAPSDYHLLVEADRTIALSADTEVLHSRPSINVLFESAAEAYGPAVVGVVLTGANEDGAEGLRAIAQAGGVALVQDPSEAFAKAMPSAALAACASAQSLSLSGLEMFLLDLGTSPP
jgi:two-component system chemotaxis response regulator CheB